MPHQTNRQSAQMQNAIAVCPMHATQVQQPGLDPGEELLLPMHKRVVTQYAVDAAGTTELRLYYGDKEISFDEEELFPFGECLAKQESFIASAAAGWGQGYEWPRIKELLEQLLEEGILQRVTVGGKDRGDIGGECPSPLPPAVATAPRTWLEAVAVTTELTGRALEPGYLELVIPIFRIAHMVLDTEGRQVGEANVFPKALRLDVPTRWRTCIYPGTRFQSERPMNVTALKSMRAHWPHMMAMLLRIRQAYLQRFPAARAGWTVGHLERLAVAVLALPTFMVMRAGRRVDNGDLHPALSSLFRVTDGLRMTMHQMLFVPIGEPALPPETPMTSKEIFAYAERNYSFFSDHGVCAGPQAMIEEFLGVLVDGKPFAGQDAVVFDAPLHEALDGLDQAIDYGLLGLQVHAVTFSLWPAMARTYEQLAAIVEAWAEYGEPRVVALRDRLAARIKGLKSATYLATEEWRSNRDRVYADMFLQSAAGLSIPRTVDPLPDQLAASQSAPDPALRHQLRAALAKALGSDAAQGHLDDFAACIENHLRHEQAIVRTACAVQKNINALLGRLPPQPPFDAAQMDIHNLLQASDARRLPYLGDELAEALGIRVSVNQDRIEVSEQDKEIAA
jgi:hypothetical protein